MVLRNSRIYMLLPLGVAPLLLAACAGGSRDGADVDVKPGWPSLAPRVGEVSPLVPRVPMGACATCGPDAPGPMTLPMPEMAELPAPVRAVLPDDIEAGLTRMDETIARIEAAWPGARKAALEAIAKAPAGAVETEADVQASRYETLFQPLGLEDAALGALEAAMADAEGADAYAPRVAALRARLTALEAVRAAGLSE